MKTPEQMFDLKQASINKSVDIKEKNIAYFNSLNAAINLLVGVGQTDLERLILNDKREKIVEWRDWFYAEWEKWYNDTISFKPNPITDQARVAAVEKFESNYKAMSQAEGIAQEALEADRLPTVDIKDL